jgi:hypothetical protein
LPDESEPESDDDGPLLGNTNADEVKQGRLRRYQLERLRYYYAVVECDSVATAKAIFDQCDGTEYEHSSVYFDLRYCPDEMTFDDEPKCA